jgi:hypothetical protein
MDVMHSRSRRVPRSITLELLTKIAMLGNEIIETLVNKMFYETDDEGEGGYS